MKTQFQFLSAILFIVVFTACGGSGASSGQANYTDDKVSFEYPQNWEAKSIPQDGKTFYNLNSKDGSGAYSVNYVWMIEDKNEYLAGQDQQGLEDYFNSTKGKINRSELIKTKSEEDFFYIEFERDGSNGIAFYGPYNDQGASYSVSGGPYMLTAAQYEVVKNNEIPDFLKSLELKVK